MATVGFTEYTGFPGLGGINMDQLHLSDMLGVPIVVATSTRLLLQDISSYDFTGTGFTYDANDQITGGTLNSIAIHQAQPHHLSDLAFFGLNLPIAPFAAWILTDSTATAFATMLAGNDTIQGTDSGGVDGQGHGSPGDLLRGYDGNDQIVAGGGPDTVFGGNGDDTISGGAGADTFHTFSGAGVDRVMDFHLSEGDRVQVDVGTTYTVTQVNHDTVIDMGNGDQMVLVGVQLSTLTPGWIFTA